ncbi:MAG: LpxI family protein [Alphaproteobacteria bacterium]
MSRIQHPENAKKPKLGILAGAGSLPLDLLKTCLETKRDVCVISLEGYGEVDAFLALGIPAEDVVVVRIGAAGKILKTFKKQNVAEIVIAGKVDRPSLKDIRPDLKAAKILAKVTTKALGDDGLLTMIVREVEKDGFRVVGVADVIGSLIGTEGVHTALEPDLQAMIDIRRGFDVAKALGNVDVGQSVVVQQGIVLGLEGIEGTDALIKRCAALHKKGDGGVLVKCKKNMQDARVDLPTIGIETVESAASSKLRGIAIEAGGTIFLEKEKAIQRANELGIFLIGVTEDSLADDDAQK